MPFRSDIEGYIENRVEAIDEELSLWFGVEGYEDSLPDVEVSQKYRTAAYNHRTDTLGISTAYIADKSILELEQVLAEELTHRIHDSLNPDGSNDISEFFGRLGEQFYARRYGREVNEVEMDEVRDVLEEKTALEDKAKQRGQEIQSKLDELPDGEQFIDRTEEVLEEISDQNYDRAREILGGLKEAARAVDPDIILPDLENVENTIQELEDEEIKYGSVEDIIELDVETAGDFYADQYENAYSSAGARESLVSIGSENVRQHLTYAFADRHFENIESMSPGERAKLLEKPESIWSVLVDEDEELQEFYQENKAILESNLDFVGSN